MLDVDTDAVRGAALAVRRADRATRNAVKRNTRAILVPLWRRQVEGRVVSERDRHVYLRGSKPNVSLANYGGKLTAATGARPLGGGLVPRDDYAMVEFGSSGRYARRGQLPASRGRSGRVAYPSIARWAPTAARVWLRTLADTIRDAGIPDTGGGAGRG